MLTMTNSTQTNQLTPEDFWGTVAIPVRSRGLDSDGFTIEPGKDRQHARITIAMAGLGESWTLPNVHIDFVPTIVAAAASGRLTYGPDYCRQMAEAVRDATQPLVHDDHQAADYFLGKIRRHLA